ncbi:stomatin-like isoform X2 [Mercenaria mercenaria]|uniref:stomatin-like isoform X2 n=1 Tax=Mercenaria mercenaria TaxID=6596 RepID=UPI00234F05F9|nr:stomatin-like isoform X2 [Mercenaria mercenaria]XP_053381100.1 stomatin-like isoform X2 [Mercenaria mercenaria]
MSARKGHNPLHESDGIAEGDIGCCGYVLIGLSYLLVIVTFPFSLFWCLKVVQEYERAVIFRLGRIKSSRAQGPGLFFLLPIADTFAKVDLRTFNFNIPPQEILTKDSVTCVVDAVIYARVFNATKSVVNILNARASTNLLGATTLRTIVGTVGLAELLSDRERIDKTMKNTLDRATDNWGVKVERVEIKDVRLPVQMQRAMAAEAESAREASAKIVSAEGELKASRSLKEAADVLSETPASLQLRYLQTLQSVSEEQNHTIVFPMPANLFSAGVRQTLGRLSGSLAGAQSSQSGQPLIDLQQMPDNAQF